MVHPEPSLAGIPQQGYVLNTSRKDLVKEQRVNMQALLCQLVLEVPLLGAATLSRQGQGQGVWEPGEAGPL